MTPAAAPQPTPAQAPLPPLAPGYPLVGNVPELRRMGLLPFMEKQWKALGDVFRVRMGPSELVVAVHPDAVERILASNKDNYVKGDAYNSLRELTGDSVLTMEGRPWKRRRNLEQPSFHRESIRKLVSAMATATRRLLSNWRERFPQGGIIETHREMSALTLDMVGEALFGQQLSANAVDSSSRAFGEALELLSGRGNSFVLVPRFIPTPSNLRLRRALQTLHDQVHAIIAHARAQPDREARPTLLNMLLEARDAETGESLTDAELHNEVITLFLAGHETTALLLTWGFTLLADQPEVVRRMRDEVQAVLGGREPTAEDLPKLVYVRQVIDEILRLRTPTFGVARDVVGDDVLHGFRVRRGDRVMPMNYLTHRHPDFWPDPERFDPDRFSPERSKGREHWAYFPFSLGPRICIGNIFALTESQLALAMMLQAVDFEVDMSKPVPMVAAMTMRPGAPVPMRLSWRG